MEAEKKIRIACEGAATVPVDELLDFQGDLKTLSEERYQELRHEILTEGFSFTPHVWRSPEGLKYLIDGHQRKKTVTRMRDKEGYEVPELPVAWVLAPSYQDAKRKVLSAVAQYGQVQKKGLADFMADAGLDFETVSRFPIPEIDMAEFKVEFVDPPAPASPVVDRDESKTQVAFEAYKNASIKQVVLYFALEEYATVLKGMDELAKRWNCEDYSQVVWRLLRDKLNDGSGTPQA